MNHYLYFVYLIINGSLFRIFNYRMNHIFDIT